MTRKTLYVWIIIVIGIYLSTVFIGIALRVVYPDCNGKVHMVYSTYKDVMPLIIAIPAAWLGYCFQRRSSYLAALREFWAQLIPSIQEAIQYTHLSNPTKEEFASIQKNLRSAIDSLRGIFKNIPQHGQPDLYPYENLKDIEQIISWLRFTSTNSKDERFWARKCITTLWISMHHMLLLEFDREVPVHPLSKYLELESYSVADYLKKTFMGPDGRFETTFLEERLN